MNEFSSAMGLIQLEHIASNITKRNTIIRKYRDALAGATGLTLLPEPQQTSGNGSYFPILVEEAYPLSRDELYFQLKEKGVHGRRYFYPLISNMPMYKKLDSASKENLPIANDIADKVLCLPVYPGLSLLEVETIVGLLLEK